MSLAIRVNQDLADLLAAEAERRRVSMEEFAVSVLRNAVAPTEKNDGGAQNQRRMKLLRKSMGAELTPADQAELADLPQALDQRFESFDRGLQATIAEMRSAVEAND